MSEVLWEFLVIYLLLFLSFLLIHYIVELIAWVIHLINERKLRMAEPLEESKDYRHL